MEDKTKNMNVEEENEFEKFSSETKKEIVDIINDCPSLVMVPEKE